MAATDLREREAQAGGDAGDIDYDARFNELASQLSQDEFDAIIARNYGGGHGDTEVDAHGDTIKRNWNADDTDDNGDAVRDLETNPQTIGQPSAPASQPTSRLTRLRARLKGKSATASITGVLVGGGAASMLVLSPGILLVQMKEIFHNDGSAATRTNLLVTRAVLSVAFRDKKADPCEGKSKISCKLGTASKSMVEKLKKAGFTVNASEVDANGKETGKNAKDVDTSNTNQDNTSHRYKIASITFPGGFEAKTGKEFHEQTDKDVESRRQFTNAFNPRSTFYKTKKFTDTLVNRLKIKRGKQPTNYAEGETKEAQEQRNKQFDSATDGVSDEDAASHARTAAREQIEDDVNEKANRGDGGGKAGGFLSLVQAACAGYKTGKIAVGSVKAMHMARLANFAMEFLKAADAIKTGVAAAAAISYLSDKLTYVERDPESPKYNLSATDSQGYRIAAHGDKTDLLPFAEKYVLGGVHPGEDEDSNSFATNALLGTAAATAGIEVIAAGVVNVMKPGGDLTGEQAMREACRSANSYLAIAAQCAAGATSLTGIMAGTTGPLAGIGVVMGLKMCQCQLGMGPEFLKDIADDLVSSVTRAPTCDQLESVIDKGKKALIAAAAGALAAAAEQIIRNWNIGSDTKGVDAGNAIAAGATIILASAATSYALKPGTKAAHRDYMTYTDTVAQKYEELDRLEGREAPLDINNRYSFLGTLARSVSAYNLQTAPIFSGAAGLLGLVPSAVSQSESVAYGLYSQPVEEPEERYDCNNEKEQKAPELAELGVDGNKFCTIITYTPKGELQTADEQAMDPESTAYEDLLEWMENSQGAAEKQNGTLDDTDGCDDECMEKSKQKSIDENGKPVKDSQYDKWITYCTDMREDPWGISSQPYEEGSDRDQEWFTGKKCLDESTMLTNFRNWHRVCATKALFDATTFCYDDPTQAAAPAGPASKNTGDWVIPTSGPCLSGYGPRWGTQHAGIDISPPQGTAIVAPTSMRITHVGDKGDGYGTSVTAVATDDSGNSFRFAHMVPGSPKVHVGQVVSKTDVIGQVGSSGDSTGPHLHFEIFPPGGNPASYSGAVDPVPVLAQHGVQVSC